MKSDPVIATTLGRELVSGRQTIYVPEKDHWLASVTVGQILKGRIMRSYGEDRYGVYIAGQERVVDSAVPLSVGDVLYGRVVGVSERSVSMHIVRNETTQSAVALEQPSQKKMGDPSADPTISALVEQAKVKLDPSAMTMLSKVANDFDSPEMVIKIGLYLAKLGLPVSAELVRVVSKRILDVQASSGQKLNHNVPQLITKATGESNDSTAQAQSAAISQLAEYFSKHYAARQRLDDEQDSSEPPTVDLDETQLTKETQSSSSGANDQAALRHLVFNCFSQAMNIKTGAAYQHRFQTLPIVINDKLVEFNLALFDQSADSVDENGVRSRHLKFSLQTQFGVIGLDAHILNHHVHLQLVTDSEWLAKEFELHHAHLSSALDEAGWRLDSAKYESGLSLVNPAAAVVDHVLAQDSLRVTI